MPITSDKGLCGGTNSIIIKMVKSKILFNRDAFRVYFLIKDFYNWKQRRSRFDEALPGSFS